MKHVTPWGSLCKDDSPGWDVSRIARKEMIDLKSIKNKKFNYGFCTSRVPRKP
jgi:hypothetical protein